MKQKKRPNLTAMIFVRVTPELRAALEKSARAEAKQTGEPVNVAAIVRRSIAEHLGVGQ